MTIRKVTRRQAAREMNCKREFRTATGSHKGVSYGKYEGLTLPTDTQLPKGWRDLFLTSGAEYVVWSYETPIAWWTPTHKGGNKENNGWTIPDVSYSPTTSRYQGMANLAAHLTDSDPYWEMFND